MGSYETIQHFNDIKEHLHTVKRDVQNLVQTNVQVRIHLVRKDDVGIVNSRCGSGANGSFSSRLSMCQPNEGIGLT